MMSYNTTYSYFIYKANYAYTCKNVFNELCQKLLIDPLKTCERRIIIIIVLFD